MSSKDSRTEAVLQNLQKASWSIPHHDRSATPSCSWWDFGYRCPEITGLVEAG